MLLSSLLAAAVCAKLTRVVWDVGFVDNVNPDKKFARRVIGVNGKWPIPAVYATEGDDFEFVVKNSLPDVTALHFHGLFQNGTTSQDGAAGVSFCGVAPGTQFTHKFEFKQHGVYWIHAHINGQYIDGLRTPLIIAPKKERFPDYKQITISVSDWYHEQHATLLKAYLNPNNPEGKEPVPDSAIINDGVPTTLKFKKGETYLLNIVSMAAFAGMSFYIDNHDFKVVQVDGVDVKPVTQKILPIAAAQRYQILVNANQDPSKSYNFRAKIAQDMLPDPSPNPNAAIPVVYGDYPVKFVPDSNLTTSMNTDQNIFVPIEQENGNAKADQVILYNITTEVYSDDINHLAFNQQVFELPRTPSVLSVLTNSKLNQDTRYYGITNARILKHLSTVNIVVNNFDPGSHPFHMHGHAFRILYTSPENGGVYDPKQHDKLFKLKNPPRRDVAVIPALGFIVLQIVADNPGAWLFHCHIEWHFEAGLGALFIEAPNLIQKVPKNVLNQCNNLGIATTGNAAGIDSLSDFGGIFKNVTVKVQ